MMIYKKFQYASLCSFLRNLFLSQCFLFDRELEPVKHNGANLAGSLSFTLTGPPFDHDWKGPDSTA